MRPDLVLDPHGKDIRECDTTLESGDQIKTRLLPIEGN